MRIAFTKMHGLGNDFIIINNLAQTLSLTRKHIAQLADRHTGVGFDQLLMLEPPPNANSDFTYRVFNADGHEAGQCGNGARCFAAFVRQKQLSHKDHLILHTPTGQLEVYIKKQGYTVNMGVPSVLPKDIPFITQQSKVPYSLNLDGQSVSFGVVNVGNPHAVIKVNNCATAPVNTIGAQLTKHASFPQSVNVGFMEIVNSQHIRLRVYERGAGETLACGSGAVAAVIIGRIVYNLDEQVNVSLPGGELSVSWKGESSPVWQTGPVAFVFEGTIQL